MAFSKEAKNTQRAFFALLQAGLWERDVELQDCGDIDFAEVFRLGEEQAVLGLVAAGLDHVKGQKPPKEEVLKVIGKMVQLEQRNSAMNRFIGELVSRMQKEGIYTLLVKGQGVAQCYERPLWRTSGDIDFFLSDENFDKALEYLTPLAQNVDREESYSRHIGMTIDPWIVELHGSLRCGLSSKMDKVIDELQEDSCGKGNVRIWKDGGTDVLLPEVNNDILFIFTHFLKHFYKGGIGLRQICDWCRLLWTYKDSIDIALLEQRLRKMGLMSEWKVFGAFAVEYLGMPLEAMPLLNENDDSTASTGSVTGSLQVNDRLRRKAERICSFVMEVGNFGHNRDTSYYSKYPFLVRKAISMGWRIGDLFRHARIFPLDSLRFFPKLMFDGVRSAVKGE